jgi:hypothetical protein
MKLAATIGRSLRVDMRAELRDIERAVATGTRDAGRGLKAEVRRTKPKRRYDIVGQARTSIRYLVGAVALCTSIIGAVLLGGRMTVTNVGSCDHR